MKIGIITFHRAENFGSALQAFALSKYLESVGHFVTIIDFVFEQDMQQYHLFRMHVYGERKRAIIGDLLYLKRNASRKFNFDSFRKLYLKMTPKTYKSSNSLAELNESFDCFICGSDQIWNLNCTNGIVPEYFLEFVDDKKLKVAIAPSMPAPVDEKYYRKLKTLIDRLNFISVREKTTIEYLKNQVRILKPIIQSCDPTLLLKAVDYINIFHLDRHSKDYIFVYILGDVAQNNKIVEEALRLQKKTSLKIKYVFMRRIKSLKSSDYCLGIGPREFLQLILDAKYVITDSFHATVFSMQFATDFCVFPRRGSEARMTELLESVGLQQHLYGHHNPKWDEVILDSDKMIEALEKISNPTKEFIGKVFDGKRR